MQQMSKFFSVQAGRCRAVLLQSREVVAAACLLRAVLACLNARTSTHTHMHSTFAFPQGCVSYRIYPRRARARVVGVMHHHCCLHGQPVLIKVMTSCSLQQSHLVRGKISKHTRKSPSNKKGLCKLRASNKVAKDTMSRSRPAGAQKPSLTAHVR